MTKCLYCRETMLAKDDPRKGHPLHPSREHIIQAALGGTNQLSTFDSCVGCNQTLGDTVDAEFINSKVLAMIRQEFGLTGYGGKVPDVVLHARSVETGEPALLTFPTAGELEVDQKPVVIREERPDGSEQILVAGSRDAVARILAGMQAKAAKTGRKLIDDKGAPLGSIEAAIAAAHVEQSITYQADVSVNMTVIHRGLIKIAYGFAHLLLGPEWSLDSRADPLRNAARGLATPEEINKLMIGVNTGFRVPLLAREPHADTRHVVAIILGDEPMIFVSLFGNQALTAGVRLDAHRIQVEEGVARGPVMVTIDPRSGDTISTDLFEFTRRVVTAVQ